MRDDLAEVAGITEKRMFGGLAFMLEGNMLCGVHKGGGIFRVGPLHQAQALAIPGAQPMGFTMRPMADDSRRLVVLALAQGFVSGLPGK